MCVIADCFLFTLFFFFHALVMCSRQDKQVNARLSEHSMNSYFMSTFTHSTHLQHLSSFVCFVCLCLFQTTRFNRIFLFTVFVAFWHVCRCTCIRRSGEPYTMYCWHSAHSLQVSKTPKRCVKFEITFPYMLFVCIHMKLNNFLFFVFIYAFYLENIFFILLMISNIRLFLSEYLEV